MLIKLAHHDRLDCGEDFGGGYRANAQRRCQNQSCTHVPADHATARGNSQLTTKAGNQIPDLPAFKTLRLVQDLWAVFAGFPAGLAGLAALAVSVAPAEDPFGKGDKTFFS